MSRALLKFSRQASVVEHAMLQRPAFQGRGVDGVLGLEAVGNVLGGHPTMALTLKVLLQVP